MTVLIKSPTIPYLQKDVLEEYATLKFYSVNNEVLHINPLILLALKSSVISAAEDSQECSVVTPFSIDELKALKEFSFTGESDEAQLLTVLELMGINQSSFTRLNQKSDEDEVKDEEMEIKDESADDYKENDPDEFIPEPSRKSKSLRKLKKKFRNEKLKRSSKALPDRSEVLPDDYELPLPLDKYLENPTNSYKKKQLKVPDSGISCSTCGLAFKSKSRLQDHMTRIHEDHLKCPLCLKIFREEDQEAFKLHMYNHELNSASQFSCIQCGKEFNKRIKYQQHLKIKGPFHDDQCSQCQQIFASFSSYKNHVNDTHFGQWVFKCGFCKTNFEEEKSLASHVSFVHKGRTVTSKPAVIKTKALPDRVCDECGKSVKSLRDHMKTVHEAIDLKLPCPHCNLTYKTDLKRRKHIETVHVKDPCPDCGKMVGRRDMWRHKKSVHTTDKNFKCSVCTKSFVNNQKLRDHMNIHTGEKPYKCKYCNACFASAGTHGMHQRGHLGYKRPTK